jgi:hypothetical protein
VESEIKKLTFDDGGEILEEGLEIVTLVAFPYKKKAHLKLVYQDLSLEVESNSKNNFGGSVEMKAANFQLFSVTVDENTDVRDNDMEFDITGNTCINAIERD